MKNSLLFICNIYEVHVAKLERNSYDSFVNNIILLMSMNIQFAALIHLVLFAFYVLFRRFREVHTETEIS